MVLVNNSRVSNSHSVFDIEHPFHPTFENKFTMNFQSIFAFKVLPLYMYQIKAKHNESVDFNIFTDRVCLLFLLNI